MVPTGVIWNRPEERLISEIEITKKSMDVLSGRSGEQRRAVLQMSFVMLPI